MGHALLAAFAVLSLALSATASELPVGTWTTDGASDSVLIEETRFGRALGGKGATFYRLTTIDNVPDAFVIETFARVTAVRFERIDEALTLHWPDGSVTYERATKAAPALASHAIDLPDIAAPVSEERRAVILDELAKRRIEDQRVRAPGAFDTQEGIHAMLRVDADNTAWLRETLADVGWIDATRFGKTANDTTFLIVQHSGDLELMVTALPLIEADVAAGLADAQSFALLHDRLSLRLGRKQRYGSQLGSVGGGDDTLYVYPLEQRDHVDEWRDRMGMSTIAAYHDRFYSDRTIVYLDEVIDERARAALGID